MRLLVSDDRSACMGGMTEQPPAAVTEDLDRLQAALDAAIPARTDTNLLVGTYSIRALGDLPPSGWPARKTHRSGTDTRSPAWPRSSPSSTSSPSRSPAATRQHSIGS